MNLEQMSTLSINGSPPYEITDAKARDDIERILENINILSSSIEEIRQQINQINNG